MSQSRKKFDHTLLKKLKKMFNRFIQEYKSSQDYQSIEKSQATNSESCFNNPNDPESIQYFEAGIITHLYISINRKVHEQLPTLFKKRDKNPFYPNTVYAIAPTLIQHGSPINLAYAFLNQINLTEIYHIILLKHLILDNNEAEASFFHGAVAIYDKNGNAWVFDPTLKIQCPLEEYYSHPKYLGTGRALTKKTDWTFKDILKDESIRYINSDCIKNHGKIFSDIEFLKKEIDFKEEIDIFKTFKAAQLLPQREKFFALTPLLGNEQFKQALELVRTKEIILLIQTIEEKNRKANGKLGDFLSCVKQQNWGSAIRTACTSKIYGVELINLMKNQLLSFFLPKLIIEPNKEKKTAFHIAADKGNVELFNVLKKILIENQISINTLDANGKTAQQVLDEVLQKDLTLEQSPNKTPDSKDPAFISKNKPSEKPVIEKDMVLLFNSTNPDLSKWIPIHSCFNLTASTTLNDIQNLKWNEILVYVKNPSQEISEAIPPDSNLLINSETMIESIQYINRKNFFYLVNSLDLNWSFYLSCAYIIVGKHTDKNYVEYLNPQNFIILTNPSEDTAQKLPDNSNIMLTRETKGSIIKTLQGKNCLITLLNLTKEAAKQIPAKSHIIINKFTSKAAVQALENKDCLICLDNPSEEMIKAIPNGSSIIIHSITASDELKHLAGKNCFIRLKNPTEKIIEAIPDQSKIDLENSNISQHCLMLLAKKQCIFEKKHIAAPEKMDQDQKKPLSQNPEKNASVNIAKEVSFSELQSYFYEIKNKLDLKGGLISSVMESAQGLTLFLKKSADKKNSAIELIAQLKQIPKITFESGINANFIKIDAWISREDFIRSKILLNFYEEKEIEIATQGEKKNTLNAFQNTIQSKGYILKIEFIEETSCVTFESDMLKSEDGIDLISKLKKIEEGNAIEIQGDKLTITDELTSKNFNLIKEALNHYGESLIKKIPPENQEIHLIPKTEEKHIEDPFSYIPKIEKPKNKQKSSHTNKKPKTKNHQSAKVNTSSKSTPSKKFTAPYFSNPTYEIPSEPTLTLDEKIAMEKSKRKEDDSELFFGSSSSSKSISSSGSTSSSSYLSSTSFFSSSATIEVGKKVHCVYNNREKVESFIYPQHFENAIGELERGIQIHEVLKDNNEQSLSYSSIYAMIQLLELTQKLFEDQQTEQKQFTFASKIAAIGLLIQLRHHLKPEFIFKYKEKKEYFQKFTKKFYEFRDQLIENLQNLISGYKNDFERNDTLSLTSMKSYTDEFVTIFEKLDTQPSISLNHFPSSENMSPTSQLKSLVQSYDETVSKSDVTKDLNEKMMIENELKYVIIAIADLSEKIYPQDKNHLLGLICIRNRFMHVMESEGDRKIRDLSQDSAFLKDTEMLTSIEFIKSKSKMENSTKNSM